MAGSGTTYDRSLEETPTWAVAVVCFGIVLVSIIIEHVLELIGEWFHKKQKKALYEALLVVKTELMLLGFISLLLTFTQDYIIQLCIPKKVGNTWHPCPIKEEKKKGYTYEEKYCGKQARSCVWFHILQGKVPLVSKTAIHQLHIFIFVLAVCHVLYCILTMALGRAKMRKWNNWEKETKSAKYQFTHDPDRFRYARDTTFGRRHMSIWSRSTILLWITCFFRQFVRSVPKVDYLTLRHGFIMAHLAPQSAVQFDFQKYMMRCLDEDFKVVVGIRIALVFVAALYSIDYRGDVVQGEPTVKPTDDLFWFGSPRLILNLIHFVLFQNAFQVAFFIYTTSLTLFYVGMTFRIFVQILCSYVTLPLHALVTQMGSNMKTAVFDPTVAVALKKWHHQAKKQIKESRISTPTSSMPSTPHYGMSPVHLLHNKNNRSSEANSPHMSPMHRNYMGAANDHWDSESPSPIHDNSSHNDPFRARLGPNEERRLSPSELIPVPNLPPVRSDNERSGGDLY
ncbi:hypothetical protein C5167_046468 [Papaver somniferum]|uniref:MLO-like protein n=1 Tax=Papaver somniferum TaxID=3469 RepID=A0A4Y7LG50_PAPSO|nr:hypothetical protein C5167_046468 [Papaver somniferum]